MNAHTLSRRNRPGRSGPRRALALAALAATAMLAVACGGNSPPSATGSQYQKALAFSKCMRAHGALGFPDPTSQGTITVTQALLGNAQIQSAAPSCKNLLPRGAVQFPAGLQRKLETQALRYSACMRSHGVLNFPDPVIHNGSVGFRMAVRSNGGPAPQSSAGAPAPKPSGGPPAMPPKFQSAQRACQSLLPGNG